MQLDSKAPTIPYRQYMESETRFAMLWHSHPEDADRFAEQAQHEIDQRFTHYKQLAAMEWSEGQTLSAASAQPRKKNQAADNAGEA